MPAGWAAYLGTSKLPQRLVGLVESSPKDRVYLIKLADKLLALLDVAAHRFDPGSGLAANVV
jgi:hypothetical protein